MIIFSQDPGKKTGMAVYADEAGPGWEAGFSARELTIEEYFEWTRHIIAVAGQEDIHFVSESFIITSQTAKNTQAGWSLELIGVMKYIAHLWFSAPVKMQAPNIGKTFGTDSKLKTVGWYTPGKGHANDAARHLMTYAAQRGLIFDTEKLKELAVA